MGVYWGYKPFTNHLLTSGDIQVDTSTSALVHCSDESVRSVRTELKKMQRLEQSGHKPCVFLSIWDKCLVDRGFLYDQSIIIIAWCSQDV